MSEGLSEELGSNGVSMANVRKAVKIEWLLFMSLTFVMSDYFKRDSRRVDFNVKSPIFKKYFNTFNNI